MSDTIGGKCVKLQPDDTDREPATMTTENGISAAPVERLVTPRRGLFRVRKTSCWESGVPPCNGARLFETQIIDRRYCADPKKIPAHCGTNGDWWELGENHRIENGCICRDMGWQQEWFVELADVMWFVRQHGPCVVSIDSDGHESIEIYDDYRE